MALPTTGPISLSQVNIELGRAANATISLGEAAVRDLAGAASGAIGLQNLRGKSFVTEFAFTIPSNIQNANLRTLALNAGWDGSSEVIATINSGVAVTSTSTGTPAMTVNGSWPNGVTLINQGTIAGRGGTGGGGQIVFLANSCNTANIPTTSGGNGGTGLSVSAPLTLNNSGTIGGGGGGGGSGASDAAFAPSNVCGFPGPSFFFMAGGAGGGGAGFGTGGPFNRFRGESTEGSICNSCCNGVGHQNSGFSGGAGSLTGRGARSARTVTPSWPCGGDTNRAGNGGRGGTLGAAGENGNTTTTGAEGNRTFGGAGGNAITGNSNISYISTGTRLGGVS